MTYSRPTFTELQARINADLALLPAVLAEPLAAMWARACSSQHAYLDWILAQCSPLTCELERLYDWAMLYSVERLLPVAAQGYAFATGNAGAEILAGKLLRAQNGLDYEVLASVTLTTAQTPVLVRCTSKGSVTNVDAGQILTLIDPALGVNNSLYIGANGLNGGADDEDVDAWRLRVVEEWQTMVKYGGRSGKVRDYKAWAKAAHPSVSGALVQPHALGIGTVVVRPLCNSLVNRLPTQTILDAVAAYLPQIAPATADWRVVAPLLHPVTISLTLSAAVNTADNRQAISSVLADLIYSKINENDTLTLSEIDVAIMSITSDYTRNSPTSPIAAANGEVFTLNPVVFS